MDFVKEQLQQLNKEVNALAGKVEAAWEAYRSTDDPKAERRYDDLLREKEQRLPQLDRRRADLEAKLLEGERNPLPAWLHCLDVKLRQAVRQWRPQGQQ